MSDSQNAPGDDPIAVFVVMGSQGEYSDYSEWPVIAFFNESRAKEHAEKASAETRRILERKRDLQDQAAERGPDQWEWLTDEIAKIPPSAYDPQLEVDSAYDAWDYTVSRVPLERLGVDDA